MTVAEIKATPTAERLSALMGRYQVDAIKGIAPEAFRARLAEFQALDDGEMEGYADPTAQRDQSVKFQWGHNHDFGEFRLAGMMGERHIKIVAHLVDLGWLPEDLAGARVLDIGCWTGGSSLLLAAMGASVVAVEEVRKYAECAGFLADSFGADVEVRAASLYGLKLSGFDFVLLSGVLYHVSDPVLALRVAFNCLRNGGRLLIETAAIDSEEPMVKYSGPSLSFGEAGSRVGWNWFVPSVPALRQMLTDVGFRGVEMSSGVGVLAVGGRWFGMADRERHVDMMRAGLSDRGIA